MNGLGLNMGQVKKANRVLILRYINQAGEVSRKDIAHATGLTAAAVTQICAELMEEGILIETGELIQSNSAGRKKILLDINWKYRYVLGINIEPNDTVIVLSDLSGAAIEERRYKTELKIEPEEYIKKLSAYCKQILSKHHDKTDEIDAVSVGITGIVDRENGISIHAYGIWDREVEICKIFEQELGLNCYLENNVNAFSIAENIMGLGKKYDNLLIVKWGPGVGSSIIVDGEIYEGHHGKAAEIGHVIVDENGTQCSCGRRGCLETKVSLHTLKQIANFDQDDAGKVYQDIYDKGVINIFARTLVNIMTVLAPNRVVLCGPLFKQEIFRNGLIDCCKSFDSKYDDNRILYTTLGEKEEYIGPVASYLYHRFME